MSKHSHHQCTRRGFLGSLAGLTLPAFSHFGPDPAGRKVIVIGAGLSGLYCAMLLEEKGIAVTVLEASERVGGRLFTLDHLPGKPDTGALEVGRSYHRVALVAKRVGVGLHDPPAYPRGTAFHVNGHLVDARTWPTSPANNLERKDLPPSRLEYSFIAGNNPLKRGGDWLKPEFAELDIPYRDWLAARGADAEALKLIDIASNNNGLASISALDVLHRIAFFTSGPPGTLRIAGGGSRLPEAMATRLTDVRTGHPVEKVVHTGHGVAVHCKHQTVFRADRLVFALPFPALRHIAIQPALTGYHADAVNRMQATAVTQVHLAAKRPFWESDGLPANMWTDGPLERVFAVPGPDGQIARLTCWLNGAGARALDRLPANQRAGHIIDELARIRPASKGAVEALHVQSWANAPFAGGAYAQFGPGQVTAWVGNLGQPKGRLHFSGPHTEPGYPGMEAALASSERVAAEISKAFGP